MNKKELQHLEWIYERMMHVHSENENADYMLRFREILNKVEPTENYKQIKSCEIFEVEGRKYLIKTMENASDDCNLDRGQSIFPLIEL